MNLLEACLYTYLAAVTAVYDGDTLTLDIDLGLHVWVRDVHIRLARIDAPELRGEQREAGIKSRDWLRAKVLGKRVILRTKQDKTEKYGRYLGELWLDGENLNDALVGQGLAIYREY